MRSPRSFETLAGAGDVSSSCVTGNIQSVKDGGQYFTDPPSLVFCVVGQREIAEPFLSWSFHGEDI